ncbi:major facilitator superfamily domain-containing protein [Leptodontidium sp. 2 PMI_412]|nr:major facilitator superfamily domain-containing protein [Leptodontidium sp. 2 PMI_412]
MSALEKTNTEGKEVEDIGHDEKVLQAGPIIRPASLAALSEQEYDKLGKSATFKMDLVIMPCLVIMYIMNFLDRQNIAAAKLADIDVDLGLSDVAYQTCVSILFVGYISMQVPSNIIVGKVKFPAVYISAAMAVWGIISACMAATHNFTGLMLGRFFLGFVEAVFFPGALYFMSLFYNRQQYTLRVAILYAGSQLGNAFGGLLAIGILKLDGVHGIHGWRWLFIIEGVATVGLAILFVFILPNSPKNVRGHTDLEREWVTYNFAKDQGQEDHSDEISAYKGFMMALVDPKTWLLLGLLSSIFIAAAVSNFFPLVVATLGYDRETTYGLTAPPYILSVISMLCVGFHSDKKQERYLHIVCPLLVTLVANIIAISTLNTGARYTAMMLMPASFYSATAVVLSWIAGSLNQPAIKRASAIALINCLSNTPNVWTSYLYYSAPRYLTAFLVNMAAAALAILFATATRYYLRRQNVKMDKGLVTGASGPTDAQKVAGFRYLL